MVVPEGWSYCTVDSCMKIETGSRNTEDKKDDGLYPFFVRSQQMEYIDTYRYDCEAILTAGDGVGTGKVFHYIVGKFDAHQRVYVMSDFFGIEGKFFFYYFCNNFLTEVSRYTAKSSVDSVRRDMIAKMEIPLPPLPEQKRVSTVLTVIDNLIETTEKLLAKKKAIKQGVMQELLSGKRRLSEFSGVRIDYTVGDLCRVFDGTHQTPKYVDVGYPFYSVESISNNDFKNTKYVSKEEHLFLTASYKIEKGDILMTRIGSIGVCKYIDWDVNGSFYVSLALLKCNEKCNAQFIAYYSTTTDFKKELDIHSLTTAIPQKINLGAISFIKVNIPKDVAEQKAIASIIDDMEVEVKTLASKLTKYRQIKQGMLSELLTGRIRLIDEEVS